MGKKSFWMGLALLVALCAADPARADQQVDEIFARVAGLNPGMADYQANVNMNIEARIAFVPYRPEVEGVYYFKRPDKSAVKLVKAPNFLKKYPSVFGWTMPKLERFDSKVLGVESVGGVNAFHVELLPRQAMGDVQRLDVWVNTADYTVARHQTSYARNGLLRVDAAYQTIEGFTVLREMKAHFEFPSASVEADGKAVYSNYQFNQNLSDTLFKKKEEG